MRVPLLRLGGETDPRQRARWMSSFDTTPEDVDSFLRWLAGAMATTGSAQ